LIGEASYAERPFARAESVGRSLVDRFNAEAPRGWAELRQTSRNVRGVLHKSKVLREGGRIKTTSRKRIEFKLSRANMLELDRVEGDGDSDGASGVAVRNDRYAFWLRRSDSGSPWVANTVGPDKGGQVETAIADGALQCFDASWKVLEMSLPSWLNTPGFKIVAIGDADDGEDRLVRLDFHYDPADDKAQETAIRGGWILFEPSRFWCIRKYEVITPWGRVFGEIEYSDADSVPLPRRYRWELLNEKKGASSITVLEVTELAVGPTPDEEFTLSAFGLPEPPLGDPRRGLWFWVINAGGLLIFLAVWLEAGRRRRRRQVEPGG